MEFLTAQEVAELLGVEKQLIYKLTHRNQIPHIKIGRLFRYSRVAIEKWVETQSITV